MDTVIKIQELYKEYKLGVIGRGTLYRDLQSWWAIKRGREDPNSIIGSVNNKSNKNHLALENININIHEGQVIGIIGSNGAGKSTLLKILSRVTSPSKGKIYLKGRVASLLEVGTGFHPELTGRENIFLNGAINGLSKTDVEKRFDQIVEFAGVKKFLDTPVKRYSSGMHVRLGFAVAAHLDPDILIVDEVLAVGDADFQKKAINKIKEVSSDKKRTVIFVSHNMNSIRKLCDRVVVLSKGRIIKDDTPQKAIDFYIGGGSRAERNYEIIQFNKNASPGGTIVKLDRVKVTNNDNKLSSKFNINEEVNISVLFDVLKQGYNVCCSLGFNYYNYKNLNKNGSFYILDDYVKNIWEEENNFSIGKYVTKVKIPPNLLNEGVFGVTVDIFLPPANLDSSFQVRTRDIIYFDIVDNYSKNSSRGNYPYDWQLGDDGFMIRPNLNITTSKNQND